MILDEEKNENEVAEPAKPAESVEVPVAQGPQVEVRKVRLPRKSELEMFGIVKQLHGSNQIRVLCEDGIERVCRIPGKMKKKAWMRERDVVIIKLWDFQPSKADVVWRFLGFQVEHLKKKGYLKNMPV